LASIHSAKANKLVKEALEQNRIIELDGYAEIKPEQPYGDRGSRVDFVLNGWASEAKQGVARPSCYVEVKAVTLDDNGMGYFPDTVSERGLKHLQDLADMAKAGQRAVLLFCVQHEGINEVRPAAHIDAKYAAGMDEAIAQGVEVLAYKVGISCEAEPSGGVKRPQQIELKQQVPFSVG